MTTASEPPLLDQMYSVAYEELRRLARAVLRSSYEATVTPTTLVNEAWIKLSRSPQVAGLEPLHFRRVAARAMRQVLVDAARRRRAAVHGGGLLRVSFDDSLAAHAAGSEVQDFLVLEEALKALAEFSPRQASLVEGRFFGGLRWDELAAYAGCSEATVMREWRAARAWLACRMRVRAAEPEPWGDV